VPGTVEAASPRARTASVSHATRSVLLVLAFVVAVAAVRLGMEVVLLAGKGEMRDFASYYTAAVVAASGGSFYDPQPGKAWFFENDNQQLVATARRLGTLHRHGPVEHVHIFSYPPAMMLVLAPLAAVPLAVARVAWLAASVLAIGGALAVMARTLGGGALTVAGMTFLAMTFQPVRNTLDLGQVNAFVFALLVVFLALYRSGRQGAAGVALGVASAIRFHPALVILYLLWRRQFRVAGVALATAAVMTAAAVIAFGPAETLIYVRDVAPKFGTPLISVDNHSLAGFLATTLQALGMTAVAETGSPWLARMTALTVVALTALALPRTSPRPGSRAGDLELALVLVAIPLATPNATVNHLIAILPAVWILAREYLERPEAGGLVQPVLAGAALLAIGAVDDFYAHPALGTGLLILVAQIKFYGLAGLWALLVWRLRARAA
jgi:glycosyl transferase family 87